MEQGRHLRAAFPPGGAGERHAEDVLRVALGVAIVAVSAWACQGRRPSTFEVNVFQAGYDLPGYTGSVWLGLMQLGSLTAVPVVAVVALLGRRVWLALAVAVSGTAAWAAAKVLQGVVDGRSPQAALHVALRGGVSLGPTFPATQVAVAAAMATVAGSRLSGPTRRLCWLAVAAVGVARLYVGAQFPLEIAAGVALGWAVGACFNLAVGAPRGLPPVTSVRRALEDGGVNPVTLEAVGSSEKGSAVFRAVGGRGAIHVKVVGRDLPAEDWLSRAWRLLAFRELDADQARSAAHRVERDAYLTLAARQRGVPTTTVVFTRHFGTRASLLATAWVPGTTLDRLPSPAPEAKR